ncbi:response regulator [Dethiothermospora halolimnae]|uniref:response regulator n=1 Tax=Dethiothermospora halolimnae TaxID=3114390 RepID=UPI003CCBAB3B
MKILVVDDAMFMRTAIKRILVSDGHDVVAEASNGKEAVSMYKEYKPDIVTLDITMPEMDGKEALKKIIEYDPKAKAIMISALGQEVYVKECVLNGARSFIVKPFNKEKVLSVIDTISNT